MLLMKIKSIALIFLSQLTMKMLVRKTTHGGLNVGFRKSKLTQILTYLRQVDSVSHLWQKRMQLKISQSLYAQISLLSKSLTWLSLMICKSHCKLAFRRQRTLGILFLKKSISKTTGSYSKSPQSRAFKSTCTGARHLVHKSTNMNRCLATYLIKNSNN